MSAEPVSNALGPRGHHPRRPAPLTARAVLTRRGLADTEGLHDRSTYPGDPFGTRATTEAVPSHPTAHPLATRIIDLDAIAHNLRLVTATAATPVMAVVKADAFGHGAIPVARAVLRHGATWLGVATIDEAQKLRRAGIIAPILAWLVDEPSDLTGAIAAGVTLSCADPSLLGAVDLAASRLGRTARVHLELDTGMSRGGSPHGAWEELCRNARNAQHVDVEGIWSHLGCASDPDADAVAIPVGRFEYGVAVARSVGLEPRLLHLANSAGALAHPGTRYSLVRIGAALYGIETVAGREHGLIPAMRVVTRVVQTRRVRAGTGVGYQQTYRAPTDTTLALIPLGYADGVPRSLSGNATVAIHGVRHPVVGSISMDQLVVDVGDADVRQGDEVVVLGSGPGETSATERARDAGTIPHEVLTGFGVRVSSTWIGADA